MSRLRLGQYVESDTFIHRLDPRTKIAGCLALSATILSDPAAAVMLTDGALLTAAYLLARVRYAWLVRRMRGLWLMLGLSFLFQCVLTQGEPLLQWRGFAVTQEGVVKGGITVFRLLVLLFASFLLTMTTSPIRLAAGLEKLLSPLARFGVPVHKIAMLVSVSLRFLPVMNEEAEAISKAQRSRGAPLYSPNLLVRIRSLAAVLIPLLAASLQRAGELATAMESRCYVGGANPSRLAGLKYGPGDAVSLALIGLTLVLAVISK